MSERTQTTIAQDFDAMMRDAEEAQKYAAWIKQFNTLCKDLYIDLNDQESVNRIFIVPDNAVRQNANTELDFMKHAYALSAKTDEEYTAAQRAAEIFAGRQNGCDVYVAAPGSYGYRKVNFGENLKPSLSEEIYAPGEKELVAPTKPGA